ncbi:hypothetical protein HPP92_027051 [Vanilla planifolia]|uniref:Uncharacterized protein n=1 Tax=Vanilla planifolia TaxID=51239 RepID=A0A835PGG3_VANPL|nr:hypothetical protein HPP92_027170 [Vanilla planifolia]KAG0449892.1 hypothetical protein HPP92_027051 [Vanilla planifolia]
MRLCVNGRLGSREGPSMKHGPLARQSDTWNAYNPKGHRRSRPGPQRNGSLFIAVMGGAKRGDGCCLVLELSSKRVLDADGGKKGSRFRLEKGMCVADVDRCEAWRKSRDGYRRLMLTKRIYRLIRVD